MKKIVALTGAGISAESGVATFRDSGGLWEGHDVMQVASIEGWKKDPKLVLDFYNKRRRQLKDAQPNRAHLLLAELQNHAEVTVVTQNVDDLHERAGSQKIIHLHGELNKVRSSLDESFILNWKKDLTLGDCCPKGGQLRPHIVWFGELVPQLDQGAQAVENADIVLVIGTSLQVYPAAGLVTAATPGSLIWYVDPKPAEDLTHFFGPNLTVVKDVATEGVAQFVKWYKNQFST